MNGSHEIIVKNNRVQYRFTISRNLTMLRGNSATGKSTLVDMVAQYARSDLHGSLTRPDLVIVEDSNAGYQFFQHYYEQRGISCRAAGGKSRIAAVLATVPVDAAIVRSISAGSSISPAY